MVAAHATPPKPNVFLGTLEHLATLDIDAPIRECSPPTCEFYISAYAESAKKAAENGNEKERHGYWFLKSLVSFMLTFDTPGKPFSCYMQGPNGRSALPEDLTDADIAALKVVAYRASDPALKARFNDVLFLLARDPIACRVAVEAYLASATRLDTSEDWPHAYSAYKRAMQLAQRLGVKNEPYQAATKEFLNATLSALEENVDGRSVPYMRLAEKRGLGDPLDMAERAKRAARSMAGNQDMARAYWEIAKRYYARAKNTDEAAEAKLAAAETFLSQAAARVEGPSASYMAAASILMKGVLALQKAGAASERIGEAKARLAEYQRASASEMKAFSTQVDISDLVSQAADHVGTTDFRDALFRLAFGADLIDLVELRRSVEQAIDQFPLSHLFGEALTDSQGRVIKNNPPLILGGSGDQERIWEEKMFSHATSLQWSLRSVSFIEPARHRIYNDHHPTLEDLIFVVDANPFVPQGHEDIFLRGLHAGLHGDFVVAAHLLTPQIENSIRHVLESDGVDISNLMSDETQPVKILGGLFGLEDTKRLFGKELVFELRGHLNEKLGFDFRNKVAHGFVSTAGCYSPAALGVWWLVLRICLGQVR